MDSVQVDGNCSLGNLQKGCFQFKKESDGTILIVHHTAKENSKVVRIRFVKSCFSDDSKYFIALDHRGNIFIFDLMSKNFWKLTEKIPNCAIIRNIPQCPLNYIIGTKDGQIIIFNIRKLNHIKQKKFSNYPIEGISFSTIYQMEISFLIYSRHEAILISLDTLEQSHRLDYNKNKIAIKHISFIPNSDRIFACFSNDSVHIWSSASLNIIRVIHPIRMRDRYLKQGEISQVSVSNELQRPDNEFDVMFKSIAKDFSRGVINSFSFSLDGKYILLTTIDDFVILLSATQFEIVKIIKLTDNSCKTTGFLPQATSDMTLYLLTVTFDVVLFDCSSLNVKAYIQAGNSYRMNISNNGKMLAVILKSGEVKLYRTSVGLNLLKKTENYVNLIKNMKDPADTKRISYDCDLKQALTRNRLIPILREYGEYPAKYRHLIWCSFLELPNNSNEFMKLLQKKEHPTVLEYDKVYALKDATALRSLKRTVSCLTHWCKVFGHCAFLPNFVFPFLKIYPNSPLLMFELLATLLLNYCQLWFEFTPLEPINYLGIIENILREFEPSLGNFYSEKQITAKTYAWSLLSTAFSEVLDEHQWYRLWDHIISYQPEFLLFCVVAYNIIQKSVIMQLQTSDSVEEFFHDQNLVDIKKLINRAATLMEKCPVNIHPRRHIQKFVKLPKGFYPKFENYPKEWVNLQDNEMETLQLERKRLDVKIRELEKVETSLAKQLEEGLKQEEHENRMKAVEKLYSEALTREQERISCQRKMLLIYQKEIRDRKSKVLNLVRDSAFRRNSNLHENELDTLMRGIERSRTREETDMLFADENIKIHELNLLSQSYRLEMDLMDTEPFQSRFKSAIDKLDTEKSKLASELRNLGDNKSQNWKNDAREDDSRNKMNDIERTFENIQRDFLQTIRRTPSEGTEWINKQTKIICKQAEK